MTARDVTVRNIGEQAILSEFAPGQRQVSAAPEGSGGGGFEVRIAPEDTGDRLDRVLQRHLPELSRSRLKQLILDGHVESRGPDGGLSGGKGLRDPAARGGP